MWRVWSKRDFSPLSELIVNPGSKRRQAYGTVGNEPSETIQHGMSRIEPESRGFTGVVEVVGGP